MSEAVLEVISVGPLVSIQDRGRSGFMRFGVPASGPMDRLAAAAANAVLGNAADAPVIEVSLGGLALRCVSGGVTVAVAGGGFRVHHGETDCSAWHVLTLEAGCEIAIRPGFWGSWCYLAFAGQLAAHEWLGSAATHSQSGLGGGRLAKGQELRVTAAVPLPAAEGHFPCPVAARARHTVRVTPGPQDRHFDPRTIAAFAAGPWRLSDASDRMGVRLLGPAIAPRGALDIPSEPITRGAVQVAGDGIPAVLMADHQTTGGYPKIATVIDCDLDGFAQLRPRAPVEFRIISAEDAVAIARRRALLAELYLGSLRSGAERRRPGAA